ncbi:MAG: N-acetyl-gamma-glutamyl-phosphate reductase [Euryarchaeota archaeon]|nr:N-acetyl-gamma-glutamyl-phosphate reductase [Euryarchaeota archaeon]
MLRAGIIGASGYTGSELVRLLAAHPGVKIEALTSRSLAGKSVGEVIPSLRGLVDLRFEDHNPRGLAGRCDVVFTSVPHGSAMETVPGLLDAGIRVVDLSADYRLSKEAYEAAYRKPHTGFRPAVYGLPEVHPEVPGARLVANPGCYPTGCILAAAPLLSKGLVERAIFDCKSGVSGAGSSPSATSHYPNLAENIIPYDVTSHRHVPEMVQEANRLSPKPVKLHFTPHVFPAIRGILTTGHLLLREKADPERVRRLYEEWTRGKPFLRLAETPSLASVRGSNFCDIGWRAEDGGERVVVLSAIDNLVKGAAGQAIQNMNLMFGLPETEGLRNSPVP